MIEVTYHREHNRVTVRGHAYSNEVGRDLICAACSALALTLEANVRQMSSMGCVHDVIDTVKEGEAEIGCRPKARYRDSVRQVYMAVCAGFEVLANLYPDYISYVVRGF